MLDNHSLYDELNGNGIIRNFKCSEGLYRFFRIQQTGHGFTDIYGFAFRRVEFFGSLFEGDYVPHFQSFPALILMQCTVQYCFFTTYNV